MSDRLKFAALRAICAPMPEYPPRPNLLWKVWVSAHERRFRLAERIYGPDGARRWDYIPF